MNSKLARRLKKTAYHEAGHAVAAVLLNIPIVTVHIELLPSEDDPEAFPHGEVVPVEVEPPKKCTTVEERDLCERWVMFCHAGGPASRRVQGSGGSSVEDSFSALPWATALTLDTWPPPRPWGPLESSALLEWLSRRVRNLLYQPENWEAVVRVANALLERKTLQAEEVIQLVRPQE